MKKVYFPQHGGTTTEQNLVQDLVDEQIKLFGSDVFYIPRVHIKDKTLGEVIQSEFNQSYMIEMMLVNSLSTLVILISLVPGGLGFLELSNTYLISTVLAVDLSIGTLFALFARLYTLYVLVIGLLHLLFKSSN